MVRPVHLLPNLEHVARRVRRDHRGVLASRSIRNASELAAARVTLMADWRGIGEPPIDPPRNEQEGSDLEVLRSAGTSPLDPHELSYAVTQSANRPNQTTVDNCVSPDCSTENMRNSSRPT